MATSFYLDNRPAKNGECPIRVSACVLGQRLLTSIGFGVMPDRWDTDKQEVRRGTVTTKGLPYHLINGRIHEITQFFAHLESEYRLRNEFPTAAQLRESYAAKFGKPRTNGTKGDGKDDTGASKTIGNYIKEFTVEMGRTNQWTVATYKLFRGLELHLRNFDANLTLGDIDERKLDAFLAYLRDCAKLQNSSMASRIRHLKWFLRWAARKGYIEERCFKGFIPKLKVIENKVVFLEWEELMRVYHFDLSGHGTLSKVRDVFCFCCFTSLRYSDVANLRRAACTDSHITVTMVKTGSAVRIELNKYSRGILDKYKDTEFPMGLALPVISNQKTNDALKELGEVCGIDSPVTVSYYKGGQRIDEVYPKYELIGTHTGRRTFICNALALGIPAEVVMKWTGHKDYRTMRPYIDVADSIKAANMSKFDSHE